MYHTLRTPRPARDTARAMQDTLRIRGARTHNLRGVDVDLPRDGLSVITGLSGSGKSSLAFDTLYQEGQRRFLESLSPYARQFLGQMERPPVDRVENLSPTLSVDQKTVNRSSRSTVGTVTEIQDHLRLLWARLGTPRCPVCGETIARRSPGDLADSLLATSEGARLHVLAPVIRERKGEYRQEMADWLRQGWLRARIDGALVSLEEPPVLARYEAHTLEVVVDRVVVRTPERGRIVEAIERALGMADGLVSVLVDDVHALHAIARACPTHGISVPEMEPRLFSFNAPHGACGTCGGIGQVVRSGTAVAPAPWDAAHPETCPSCGGARLNAIARAVTFRGRGIHEVSGLAVEDAHAFFAAVTLSEAEAPVGAAILAEITERLRFLEHVGLGYLALDRRARTLSGGEAQRIRLAACVGSGLQGVTYVLDEPSIGLHPRDNRRMLDALFALRDAGNTVVVVEHDRETIELADHLVDIGPGAGVHGGRNVAEGTPAAVRDGDSPTARWLRDADVLPLPDRRRAGDGRVLSIRDARVRNLRGVDLDVPLGVLCAFTGVSGSGKSTLVFDVIRAGVEARTLPGAEHLAGIIEIDQQPIGRTPRSNPATYTGAFDAIRELFAATPEARARGWTKGRFSFNRPGGRCETCEGAGVRTVAMHFLADVEVPCEDCGGKRFTPETLEVTWKGHTIADVLAMPIDAAVEVFAAQPRIRGSLATMVRVGLGYVTLGQPATTLSGGEAQRLKLATELQRPPARRADGTAAPTLYVLDEPTTGLHFADVKVLVSALQALVDAGHTVLVIEHNTDVVKVADVVVELGPEGGSRGGQLLATGSPEAIARTDTPTGRVLAALPEFGGAHVVPTPTQRPARTAGDRDLVIEGARCHNLRGVDVRFPHGAMTVVTGPSGSGKTSLVFDTVFAEGQRRYVECLSTYARRFLGRLERAPLTRARGLAPAIAIDQRTSGHNPRSTVATTTELHDHFRLLWAHLGVPHCPTCDAPIRAWSPSAAARHLAAASPGRGHLVADLAAPRRAAELRAEGFARGWADAAAVPLETQAAVHALVVDRFDPATTDATRIAEAVATAYRLGRGRARFVGIDATVLLAEDPVCPTHGRVHREAPTPRHFSFNHWLGACPACDGLGRAHGVTGPAGEPVTCGACGGGRLRPELLAVRFAGTGIADVARMTVHEARAWFSGLVLPPVDQRIAEQPLREVRNRLGFLDDVGLGYLALGRTADTLSGGEAQRIRLASQLGGGLTGVLYVLDEPTIGLHPRDTGRLLRTLDGLRARGNTLVVVEHDPETMRAADWIVDMGPGAGVHGGQIVATGTPEGLGPESPTGAFLRGTRTIPTPARRRSPGPPIRVRDARHHNLRGLDVDVPTGVLVAVTGVSGSGKSSLVLDVLAGALAGATVRATVTLPPADGTAPAGRRGTPPLGVTVVDQSPIGRSPRSTPATYVGVLDPIRTLFAATPTARERGWGVGRFSYNAKDGACTVCGGYGSELVEMHFLSNVWVRCESCRGRRFAPETLEARWRDHSIADVLDLRVDEARALFAAQRGITRPLQALEDVGLGYLRLGQPATELSGGEAQRVKLAAGLAGSGRTRQVYILDEPTTGLHLSDVERLVGVFDALVEAGHTVVVVEHHLDVIRHADWVLDIGPEPGDGGGRLVAAGTPEHVAGVRESWTGRALAGTLAG
ncbi:MAG: excinuclease subunit UvrA [Pseudomonadota bacterium]